jgi:hypothetical protein
MRKLHGYQMSEIGNMDETPVWFEMPGKSTLAECGEKEICVTRKVKIDRNSFRVC